MYSVSLQSPDLGESKSTGSASNLPAPARMYAIQPVIYKERQIGWRVNLSRRGKPICRAFSAKLHGGLELALAAALRCRDALLDAMPPLSKREFGMIVRSNNATGLPGIYRTVKGGVVYWRAVVGLPGGRSRSQSFSAKRYGEEQAKALAIEARHQMLQETEGWMSSRQEATLRHRLPAPPATVLQPRAKREPASRDVPEFVFRCYRKLPNGEKVLHSWAASYRLDTGRITRKMFRVDLYGEAQAKRMAIELRLSWEAKPPEGQRIR